MKQASLAAILAILCGAVGCHSAADGPRQGTPAETPASGGQSSVVGMGRIEPAGCVIDVGAMMGDRLGPLLVKEGDEVKRGEPLAELESRGLRALELDAARLNVQKAKAASLGTAAHQQQIELLKIRRDLARKDQERLATLSKDLVTDQEREHQALLVRQAACELGSSQATLGQLQRANKLGLEAAKLDLLRAETVYARTQITAPCNGTILKIYVRPGETIANKPVLQMADLGRMVVVVEVYENEVKHLRPGQKALVTSRAFPPPHDQQGIPGKISRIGRMINVPLLKNIDPFAPADRHVVEVRVELDDASSRQVAALSNLQVDVRFWKRGQGSGARD